ncbi:MAG: universal stress protein [Gloeomargarita sp. HHBFW_bins_162]
MILSLVNMTSEEPTTTKPLHILVAVDLSEASEKALREACRLINLTQASLLILAVAEPVTVPASSIVPGLIGDDALLGLQQHSQMMQLEQERVKLALNWAEQICQEAGVTYRLATAFGDPKTIICETARRENCDLIVVGSRNLGFLHRLMTGSVSDFVVHHAQCSVLVVH